MVLAFAVTNCSARSNGVSGFIRDIKNSVVDFCTVTERITLEKDWILDEPRVFNGKYVIDGNGYNLSLQKSGSIAIEKNSTLTFRNIIIDGIVADKISCLDRTGTICFEDVIWIQEGDYIFSSGKFECKRGFLLITGGKNFSYQSDQQSCIKREGSLIIDQGVSLAYEPCSKQQNLIAMEDRSSKIILNSATLRSPSFGWVITSGTLVINGESVLRPIHDSDGVFIFGDGIDPDNNLNFFESPGSSYKVFGSVLNNGALTMNEKVARAKEIQGRIITSIK